MTSQKSGKGSPSKQEPPNIQPYPDWSAFQAYHGAGAPSPPPYWGSPIMAGHVPHAQMWGPTQGMMPPYGVPYPGVYPPGVVYAHPGVPLVAAPASTQQPSKISDDIDRSLTNKVKRLETISTQVVDDVTEEDDKGSSWSQEQSYDASCDKGDPKATDERQLKREKRKQANRESARRSRMRKQAEVEELMERYETLKMENVNLNSEINHLIEESEKLRVENAALMEKLDSDEAIRPEEMGDVNYEPSIDQQNHMNSEFMANDSTSYNGDDENESDALQNSDSVTNLLTFEPREDVATT